MRLVTLEKDICARRTCPRAATSRSMAAKPGVWRLRMASIATTPVSSAARKSSAASRSLDPRDFSTRTCLPAATRALAWLTCSALGLET